MGFTISGVIFLCVAGRDEGLLELNGKTYMLSLKVYETVKTDVAYVQDKTVSQIQAKSRIMEYLQHKPSITNQKAQELCGLNKNQTYYKLSAKMYSVRRAKTFLRMFSAFFSVKM